MRRLLIVVVMAWIAGCGDDLKPDCMTAADCGESSCATVACTAGRCVITPLGAGMLATEQTAGDCKIATCDGSGGVIQANDDTDLPTANGACVTAQCTDGVPSTPAKQAGTSCGTSLFCDDIGQCVGCIGPIECPGTDTECHARTCINETCGITNTTAGVKLVSGQVKGDCQVKECDGNGGTMSVEDDTDVPTTTNKCVTEACNMGMPSTTPLPAGTSCGTGLICDGAGTCGQCNAPSDCPGTDTDCQARTCTNHVCGISFAPSGTPTTQQTAGSCQQNQCDGAGNTMTVEDDANVPTSTPCHTGACAAGVPVENQNGDGTTCTDSTTGGTRCRAGTCEVTVALVLAGDGTTVLSGAAAQLAIEERYVSDGALVAETGNPVTLACTEAGTAGASQPPLEGFLARSVDERYVTLACYDASAGTAAVAATASATVNRLVARVDATLAVDTSTRLDAAFSGNSVRSAASTDGTAIWVAGSQGGGSTSGGTWYTTLGTTGGTQLTDAPSTNRCVRIFGGQLYGSSGAPTGFPDVFTIGSGLPTTAGQTATALPGLPTGMTATNMPLDYVLLDVNPAVAGLDTLYIADNRAAASGGGIQKWTFDGTTWTLANTFDGLVPGMYALTGYVSGSNVVLVAISNVVTANGVVTYTDDGTTTPTPTTIATAPANQAYRGVALSPH
jgi:hypothetical protein